MKLVLGSAYKGVDRGTHVADVELHSPLRCKDSSIPIDIRWLSDAIVTGLVVGAEEPPKPPDSRPELPKKVKGKIIDE